jgi:transposase
MTVPGIGPIISSAMVAAIGTGDAFSKGRDFGAWLGLMPKQLSTGGSLLVAGVQKPAHNRTHAPHQSGEFNGTILVTASSTQTGSLRHLQAKTAGTLKTGRPRSRCRLAFRKARSAW